jgi:hypothetical protein
MVVVIVIVVQVSVAALAVGATVIHLIEDQDQIGQLQKDRFALKKISLY